MGPLTVIGPLGAVAWSYAACECSVTSSAGFAGLISLDDGLGNVDGATDAFAWTVGDFTGDVTTNGAASVVALGGFQGGVDAGGDAVLLSEGTIQAGVTGGRDVAVYAVGNIVGGYTAGRDAWAWTYGAYNANLTAGRDVEQVWARGNLTGLIEAGRNIGWHEWAGSCQDERTNVLSYGAINATIEALNPTQLADGGRIGCVVARGSIAGQVTAAQVIREVRSGARVTATVTAPVMQPNRDHPPTFSNEQVPYLPETGWMVPFFWGIR